jgi:hypothetical protein
VGDKNHRPIDLALVEAREKIFMQTQAEQALKLVDDPGHPRTRSDNYVPVIGIDMLFNERQAVLVGSGHERTGARGLGMGISDKRSDLLAKARFDRCIETATRRPIGVKQFLLAVGRRKSLIYTDNAATKMGKGFFQRSVGQKRLFGIVILRQSKVPRQRGQCFFSYAATSDNESDRVFHRCQKRLPLCRVIAAGGCRPGRAD